MSLKLQYVVVLVVILAGCQYENLDYSQVLSNELEIRLNSISESGSMNDFMLPNHSDLSDIPQDWEHNPLTEEKVKLGKFLFFETGIGVDASQESGLATYSCASCHDPNAAFKPLSRQGIADGGFGYFDRTKNPSYRDTEIDAQGARPLSVLNVAFVENTFWNGQFGAEGVNVGTEHLWSHDEGTDLNALGMKAIETQNIEGVDVHRMNMSLDLAEELGMREMFDYSFPEIDESERYSRLTVSLALSAYIRSLITDKAPFQQWLRGDRTAMSDDELKGALLFFGKARCFVCHNGPNLGSNEFHALGVKDMYQMDGLNTGPSDKRNLGRGGFTGEAEDMFAFKVPQLYNMKENDFFFHGGSIASLEELVDYKDRAVSENPNVTNEMLSEKFRSLNLSSEEKKKLIAFLSEGLYDNDMARYTPNFVMSDNCTPHNDPRSQRELGCN